MRPTVATSSTTAPTRMELAVTPRSVGPAGLPAAAAVPLVVPPPPVPPLGALAVVAVVARVAAPGAAVTPGLTAAVPDCCAAVVVVAIVSAVDPLGDSPTPKPDASTWAVALRSLLDF